MTQATHLDLQSEFDALPSPPSTEGGIVFSVAAPSAISPARLAKSTAGEPAILFPADPQAVQLPPIELRHLTVLFSARCRVIGVADREESVTVVQCHGDDALRSYFFIMARALLAAGDAIATSADIERSVRALVELFRVAAQPALRSLRGLWGELLGMAGSVDPATLAEAWHVEGDERFDFSRGRQRLEVKTSGRGSRRHHFSLDQLVAEGVDACVVSLQVEPAAGGLAIADLVDLITPKLSSAAAVARFVTTIAAVLGSDWVNHSTRFDQVLAAASVRFIRVEDVPRVLLPLPVGVGQVEFVSDLGLCPAATSVEMNQVGGLWAAAVPLPASY